MGRSTSVIIIVLGLLWLGSMSLFVVNERELAVKFQLGEFQRADYTPGIYPKWPFINNVRTFDSRILTLDAEPGRYLTLEKKNVIVDSFVKWRINNVSAFYTSMRGDERVASNRLAALLGKALSDEFGKRTIQEAISGERAQIMQRITTEIASQALAFGISVVDVRIKRIELPPEVSNSVYRRMEAERNRVAQDLRSRGAEAAERIRADADRQRTVLVAEASSNSEKMRGEGDAEANQIYADAFGQDKQFFEFYRSLNAYQSVFDSKETLMVLDPKSEFFNHFKGAGTR